MPKLNKGVKYALMPNSNSNYGRRPVKIPPKGGTPNGFVQAFSRLEFRL